MSGRIAYIPPQPHPCEHPPDGSQPFGTRWDCDCGERWIALPPSPFKDDPKTHWARWAHDKKPKPRLPDPFPRVRWWRGWPLKPRGEHSSNPREDA